MTQTTYIQFRNNLIRAVLKKHGDNYHTMGICRCNDQVWTEISHVSETLEHAFDKRLSYVLTGLAIQGSTTFGM